MLISSTVLFTSPEFSTIFRRKTRFGQQSVWTLTSLIYFQEPQQCVGMTGS